MVRTEYSAISPSIQRNPTASLAAGRGRSRGRQVSAGTATAAGTTTVEMITIRPAF
jgi:hypothetical protein